MINFYCITNEDIKDHNLNWPENLDHPYRSLIIGSSGSGNPNALLKGCIHHVFNSLFSTSKRALFANTKGPGTSFQAAVSADFFDEIISFGYDINWPNFTDRLCLLLMLSSKTYFLFYV